MPPAFEAIVRRAMAKDLNERFLSAEEMGEAVAAAADGESASEQDAPVPHEEPGAPAGRAAGPRPTKRKSRKSQLAAARAELAARGAAQEAPPGREAPHARPRAHRPRRRPPTRGAAAPAAAGAPAPATPPSRPAVRRPRPAAGDGAIRARLSGRARPRRARGRARGAPGRRDDESGDEGQSSPAAAAVTPLPQGLKWRELHDAPFRRQYAAATAVGGDVWVLGGLGVKTSSTTTKAYDPVIDSWKTGPGLPLPLHHLSGRHLQGRGGRDRRLGPERVEPHRRPLDRVFALRDGAWVELPRLNHARAAAAAAVVGDKIVVIGGQADGKLVAPTEVFDGERWSDVADLPTPREHLGAASDGRYLYAVGGRKLAPDKNSRALERYDPARRQVDQSCRACRPPAAASARGRRRAPHHDRRRDRDRASSTPSRPSTSGRRPGRRADACAPARHGVAVAALTDRLYAIGGATAAGHVELDLRGRGARSGGRRAYQLSRAANGGRSGTPPSAASTRPRRSSAGGVWVLGGSGSRPRAPTTKAYDPVIDSWKTGPGLPLPLHHLRAVTYEDEAVVIGGWVPSG